MIIHAIKTAIFILIVFSHSVFAKCDTVYKDTGKRVIGMEKYLQQTRKYEREGILASCDDSISSDYIEVHPLRTKFISHNLRPGSFLKYESIYIHISDKGTKDIKIYTSCGTISESITTTRDSIGNLISSKYLVYKNGDTLSSRLEFWRGNKLVRTKYNGVTRDIIQRETPCKIRVFDIVKSESVYLTLDPKNKLDTLIQKHIIDSSEIYDVVKYYWYPHCKEYHEKHKTTEPLEDSISSYSNAKKEINISIKNDGDSLSSILLHKIIIGIVIVCIIIIFEKRKKRLK